MAKRKPSRQKAPSPAGQAWIPGCYAGPYRVHSRGLRGLEGYNIIVESTPGNGDLRITGLPTEARAREARVRVLSALAQLRGGRPGEIRDVRVVGYDVGPTAQLDLAIAAAAAPTEGACDHAYLVGELALDGSLRPVRGLRPMLLDADVPAYVPAEQIHELWGYPGVRGLQTLWELFQGNAALAPPHGPPATYTAPERPCPVVLLTGAPGAGFTFAARQLAQSLAFRPSENVDAIYSVAGMLPPAGRVLAAPFRAPHHTVSEAGLVGSGGRPGEVSLAHRGVLFLDEVLEFRRLALDALFAALREGRARHQLAPGMTTFMPAAPALVIGSVPIFPRSEADTRKRLEAFVKAHPTAAVIPIDQPELWRRAVEANAFD